MGLLAARLSGGGNLISMPSKGFGRFLLVSAARGSVSGCGGLWAAPVAGLICLWRVLMVRRSFAGWCIGRCPWYFFTLVGNANLGALCSLCFSGCGVSLRVFVIFICVLVRLFVGVIYGLAWFEMLVRCILFSSNGDA